MNTDNKRDKKRTKSPIKLKIDGKNINRKILLLIVSISSIAIVIGTSFAYFISQTDNSNNQKIGLKSGTIELTYTDCADNKQSDCADISADLKPGESITKTFAVKNTGTLPTSYKVYMTSDNSFIDDELVYYLKKMIQK